MVVDRAGAVWLARVARVDRVPVPWRDVARIAASVVAPLVLGLTWIGIGAGVLLAMGALVGSLAPQSGPLREKVRRTAAGVCFGVVGLVVGRFAAGGGWQPVLVVGALAAAAALISAISANLSFGSLQLLVYLALGSGLTSTAPQIVQVGLFVAGGAWAMLLTLAQSAAEPVDPDRAAVGAVFTAIGRLLSASGGSSEDARRALTAALNRAYDQVIISRRHSAGRSGRLSALAGVLNSTAPLVEGAVALHRAGEQADERDVAAVAALAEAVSDGRTPTGPVPEPADDGSPAERAVRHGVGLTWRVVADPERHAAGRRGRDWSGRVRDVVEATVADPDSRVFAARLALCMSVGEVARQVLPLQRPYWVLLTVAIVLKPDFGSVFARAVQRTVGTVLGVLLGALVLVVLPHDGWILIATALAAGALPWARAANYGLFSVSVTPLVLILLDLANPGGAGLVGARLLDTLVGCGIVLVFGYLIWPQTWRAPLAQAVDAATQTLDVFVEAAFTRDDTDRRRARRRAFRALTEVQTRLQRQLAEPPPISNRAAEAWPVVVQLERIADAVVEAVIAVLAGAPEPDKAQVTVLRTAIRELTDVDGPRFEDDAEILADGVLAPVACEVDTTRRLLREQAAVQQSPLWTFWRRDRQPAH